GIWKPEPQGRGHVLVETPCRAADVTGPASTSHIPRVVGERPMAIELPKLPYALDALQPHVGKTTLEFHHGKHHKAYVDKTNELIANTDLAARSLEEIVRSAAGPKGKPALFNNAARAWNHTFFWHSMSPKGGGSPGGELADRIKKDLGGVEAFAGAFKKAAV